MEAVGRSERRLVVVEVFGIVFAGTPARNAAAAATASSSSASVPGSRAARQSGSRLNVVWLSGQYQRAIRVPGGVLRA